MQQKFLCVQLLEFQLVLQRQQSLLQAQKLQRESLLLRDEADLAKLRQQRQFPDCPVPQADEVCRLESLSWGSQLRKAPLEAQLGAWNAHHRLQQHLEVEPGYFRSEMARLDDLSKNVVFREDRNLEDARRSEILERRVRGLVTANSAMGA